MGDTQREPEEGGSAVEDALPPIGRNAYFRTDFFSVR